MAFSFSRPTARRQEGCTGHDPMPDQAKLPMEEVLCPAHLCCLGKLKMRHIFELVLGIFPSPLGAHIDVGLTHWILVFETSTRVKRRVVMAMNSPCPRTPPIASLSLWALSVSCSCNRDFEKCALFAEKCLGLRVWFRTQLASSVWES